MRTPLSLCALKYLGRPNVSVFQHRYVAPQSGDYREETHNRQIVNIKIRPHQVLWRPGDRAIGHTSDYSRFQDQVEPVVQNLEAVERLGHSRYDVFTDWVDLMLYSLQRDDENYLDIVDKYDNDLPEGERPVDRYSEAFGELQRGMAETDADLLGVVYEELGMDSDAFGQYFTPHNICDAKAEMVIDVDEDRDEPYTIADPACGSGRLLISAAKKIPPGVDAVFYGQDKDATCAKMTALNFTFFNMDGYAVHGDSLKMEKHRVWQTRGSAMGGEIRELEEDEFPEIDYQAVKEEAEQGDAGESEEDVGLIEMSDGGETDLTDF